MSHSTTSDRDTGPYSSLEDALKYIHAGLPLFPLNGKRPYESGGFKTATTEETQIRAWAEQYPKCNWGMPTGLASGYDVLDVDGPVGLESLRMYEMQYGPIPETPCQETGSGGLHFLFKSTGAFRNSAKEMMPGWDGRGDGGYIVVDPSIHPETKKEYHWKVSIFDREPAEMPEPMMDLYLKQTKEKRDTYEGDILEGTQENDVSRLLGAMRAVGMTALEMYAAVQVVSQNRCKPPIKDKDLRRMVESIGGYEPNDPMLFLEKSDRGWGVRFAKFAGDRVMWEPSARSYWAWNGTLWDGYVELAEKEIDLLIDSVLSKANEMPETTDEEKAKKADMVGWALMGRSDKLQQIILRQSRRFVMGSFSEFDTHPQLLNLPNGVLDLDTRTVCDHDPKYKLTQYTPVRYVPEARSTMWEAFLARVALWYQPGTTSSGWWGTRSMAKTSSRC